MTVPEVLEASAQNDTNVKMRVYLGGPMCESAKSKSRHLRGRSGKNVQGWRQKFRIVLVEFDTFLTPHQNTNPANLLYNQTPVTARYVHNAAFNTRST